MSGRCAGAPLTAEGRAQARWLGGHFAGQGIAALHASPRLRAQQTAQAIAERTGIAVETVDALDELDFGDWTGRSFADLAEDPAWQRWNAERGSAVPPGGEAMEAAVTRAMAHVRTIAAGTWAGPVVCVSHCDVIRGVIARLIGLRLDHLLAFDVDPGSVSTLLVGDWGGRLLSLNRGSE